LIGACRIERRGMPRRTGGEEERRREEKRDSALVVGDKTQKAVE
jgi:hypothetical protein